MQRKLNIGTKKYTEIVATDGPSHGNANHEYQIVATVPVGDDNVAGRIMGTVQFQKGPIKEVGVNGVMNEDLIAIVIDRLDGFQSGDYACSENASAKMCLETALRIMRLRTDAREARGVEGTHTI